MESQLTLRRDKAFIYRQVYRRVKEYVNNSHRKPSIFSNFACLEGRQPEVDIISLSPLHNATSSEIFPSSVLFHSLRHQTIGELYGIINSARF